MATARVLVVGGGGGANAGGGGAGDVIYNASYTVTAQAYTVTVGDGGTAGVGGATAGAGESSIFGSITAAGGGKGGLNNGDGGNGASGGGCGTAGGAQTGGTGSGTNGHNGGSTAGGSPYGAGGGGGAGAVGADKSGSQSGAGGAGIADASIGNLLALTSSGVGGYIAGGGGGGPTVQGSAAGAGGSGGGGNGASNPGANATANTGSGAGGGDGNYDSGNGGAGGSGLVIVVYTTADFTHTGGDATGTSGSETWVKFTSSGTLTLISPGLSVSVSDNAAVSENFTASIYTIFSLSVVDSVSVSEDVLANFPDLLIIGPKLLFKSVYYTDANLISYFPLEGNSLDRRGPNHGEDTAVTYGTDYGKFGQGASFNGTTSFIRTARNSQYENLSAMTLSAWVKTNKSSGSNLIFSKGTYVSNQYHWSYKMYLTQDGYLSFDVFPTDGTTTGSNTFIDSTQALNDNNWHHVAITFQGGTAVKTYIDGILSITFTTSIPANTAANTYTGSIGSDNNTQFAKQYFQGSIDEVAVFSRVLSDAEILNLAGDIKENVAVSESVSMEGLGITISIYDSVAVSESVSISVPVGFSVSDSVAVSENLAFEFPLVFSVSDQITVSESLEIAVIFSLSVVDSVAVSDIASLFIPFVSFLISDDVAVSESVSFLIPDPRRGMIYMRRKSQDRPGGMEGSLDSKMDSPQKDFPYGMEDGGVI